MSESEINKIVIENNRLRYMLRDIRKQLVRAQLARLFDANQAEMLRAQIDDILFRGGME